MDDEAAELLAYARRMLDKAVPVYVAKVRADGTIDQVLAAIDGDEPWDVAFELLADVQFPERDGPLIDALFAVADELLPDVRARLAVEPAALALRAAYAATTPYDFCNHDDRPATCVACLANARIVVENNTPEWVAERLASYRVNP